VQTFGLKLIEQLIERGLVVDGKMRTDARFIKVCLSLDITGIAKRVVAGFSNSSAIPEICNQDERMSS
jgi:hypothetical protein